MNFIINNKKTYNLNDQIILEDGSRAKVIFNNCEGIKNLLLESEDGKIMYCGWSDLPNVKYISNFIYQYLNENYSINSDVAKYLKSKDTIKLRFKTLDYILRIDVLETGFRFIFEQETRTYLRVRKSCMIKGNKYSMISDTNSHLDLKSIIKYSLEEILEISFASQEEINILNNL